MPKYTTKRFFRNCGCRSVGECTHNLFDDSEERALNAMIARFAREMKAKIQEKRRQGYTGWDDPQCWDVAEIRRRLVEHVDKGDPVDIANFAAFLWNMEDHDA